MLVCPSPLVGADASSSHDPNCRNVATEANASGMDIDAVGARLPGPEAVDALVVAVAVVGVAAAGALGVVTGVGAGAGV
jgi:hypothetical protein